MRHGDDVGVDALQVAQHVEMQRAGLQAVDAAVAQAFEMALGGLLLQPADIDLHLHKLAGEIEIAGDEDSLGDAQIVDRHAEELMQLLITVVREGQALADLLCHLFGQALFDDVADMLEVDGIVDDDDRAAAILVVQPFTAELER